MVGVLASSKLWGWILVKLKTRTFVFAASPLITQLKGVRVKTGWLEVTCLPLAVVSVS